MISDAQVERHLSALRDIGDRCAEARAEYEFATDMAKTVYASEYLKSDAPRTADKEAEALASENYQNAIRSKREAMIVSEKLRHERAWHERVIDAWQTFSANSRGKI